MSTHAAPLVYCEHRPRSTCRGNRWVWIPRQLLLRRRRRFFSSIWFQLLHRTVKRIGHSMRRLRGIGVVTGIGRNWGNVRKIRVSNRPVYWESNPRLTKYEAGVLTTTPQRVLCRRFWRTYSVSGCCSVWGRGISRWPRSDLFLFYRNVTCRARIMADGRGSCVHSAGCAPTSSRLGLCNVRFVFRCELELLALFLNK
jgi:hypothetical protein